MARAKIDGVIESVRYNPDGTIQTARGYERRGVVWSDEVLLDRDALVQKLKQGKNFVTGVRKAYLGSVFNTGQAVLLSDGYIVTDGQPAHCDQLNGVGIF